MNVFTCGEEISKLVVQRSKFIKGNVISFCSMVFIVMPKLAINTIEQKDTVFTCPSILII